MLSNFDISDIAIKEICINDFRGVFCKNQLPKKLINGSFVINMENDKDDKGNINPGSHWVALFIDHHMNPYYFDSFGFPPPQDVIKFCKKTNKKIAYSQKQIQDVKSHCCGYYALSFCKYMSNKSDPRLSTLNKFDNFLNMFSDDVKKNEQILKSFFS